MAGAAKPEEQKKPRRRIKKVAGHGGHHGGSWKVAFADFATAMMALFLVLWLLSQADSKLKESIASYFRSPGAFNTVRGGVLPGAPTTSKGKNADISEKDEEQSFLAAAMALRNKFASMPQFSKVKDQVKIDVTGEGLRVQVVDKADKVSFATGSAELTVEAEDILAEISKTICTLPNPVYLGGHTDARPYSDGAAYTNWELSADRANAARRTLLANCVKPEQIRRVVGYADTEPLMPDDPYAAGNRRISIIVLRRFSQNTSHGSETKAEPEGKELHSETTSGEPAAAAPATEQAPAGQADAAHSPAENHGKSEAEPGAKSLKKRLAEEGKVSVGVPDEVPAGARRTRESKH